MINAMDNEIAFEKLTEKLASKKKDGMEYISISDIRSRVASVLAPWNFSFEILGNPQILEVRNNVSIVVTGRLTIIDDEGKNVTVRQVASGSDVAFLKDDSNRTAQEIKTYVAAACSEAYKKCWQELGIGAEQVTFKSKKVSSSEWYSVKFLSDFTVRGMVLTADVALADGGKRQLAIMKKGLDWMMEHSTPGTTVQQMIKAVVTTYGATRRLNTMSVYGNLVNFKGIEQLLFEETETTRREQTNANA